VEEGKLDAAERRLEKLVEDSPSYGPPYMLLGVINTKQNQLGQAETFFRRAASANDNDPRANLLLAETLIKQGKVSGARSVIEESSSADSALFLALAGRASLDAGQTELAQEYFARSEEIGARTRSELADLSSVYVGAGELDRAIRVLESSSVRDAGDKSVANYLLALVHLRRGDLAAAEEAAKKLDDDAKPTLALQGAVALAAGKLDDGRKYFEKVLELDPNDANAHLNLARIALAKDDRGAAVEQLQRVVESEPTQLNALIGLARLAGDRGDFEEAQQWLARAPESALRFTLSGDLYVQQRRFAEAEASYARAFKLQPSSELVLRGYAAARDGGEVDPQQILLDWVSTHPRDVPVNFALGSIALEKRDYDRAAARYEAVVAAQPKHVAALNNLAWLYGESGDARALDFAQRAYELAPNDPAVADTLGWLRVQNGAAAEAVPVLAQAAKASPSKPDIQYHYAIALADSG
jgi:tetratricopeptide (TPR) repeat protein